MRAFKNTFVLLHEVPSIKKVSHEDHLCPSFFYKINNIHYLFDIKYQLGPRFSDLDILFHFLNTQNKFKTFFLFNIPTEISQCEPQS